jgi:hypothetical protein
VYLGGPWTWPCSRACPVPAAAAQGDLEAQLLQKQIDVAEAQRQLLLQQKLNAVTEKTVLDGSGSAS